MGETLGFPPQTRGFKGRCPWGSHPKRGVLKGDALYPNAVPSAGRPPVLLKQTTFQKNLILRTTHAMGISYPYGLLFFSSSSKVSNNS